MILVVQHLIFQDKVAAKGDRRASVNIPKPTPPHFAAEAQRRLFDCNINTTRAALRLQHYQKEVGDAASAASSPLRHTAVQASYEYRYDIPAGGLLLYSVNFVDTL